MVKEQNKAYLRAAFEVKPSRQNLINEVKGKLERYSLNTKEERLR